MKSRIQKTMAAKLRDGDKLPNNPDPEPVTKMHCPRWMPKYGKELWKNLVPKLIKERVLTEWDQTSFELLCVSYHNARVAQEELTTAGMFTFAGHGGAKAHPALGAFGIASASYNRFADVFGLSPMARKRIDLNLNAAKVQKNKFAKI